MPISLCNVIVMLMLLLYKRIESKRVALVPFFIIVFLVLCKRTSSLNCVLNRKRHSLGLGHLRCRSAVRVFESSFSR